MADLSSNFRRHQEPEPVLAGLARRPPTRNTTSAAPSRPAGAAWSGRRWARMPADRQRQRPALRGAAVRPAARHRLQQHRADHRPAAADQPRRDPPGQARLARPRAGRVADGALRRRRVEGDPADGRRHRLRRRGTELRLPARHERARHGLGRGPGARVHRDGGALVQAVHRLPVIVKLTPNITDIRHPARAAKAGGADAVSADQHHQLDHGRQPATPCA